MGLPHIAFFIIFFSLAIQSRGQESDSVLFSLSQPYVENGSFLQKVDYKSGTHEKVDLQITCYQLRQDDSARLYDIVYEGISINKGVQSTTLNCEKSDTKKFLDNTFFDAVKKSELFPPGIYAVYLTVWSKEDSIVYKQRFLWDVDSTLAYNSRLRNQINNTLAPKNVRIRINSKTSLRKNKHLSKTSDSELKNTTERLNKKVGRKKGIRSVPEILDGKTYSAQYYKTWFLGRYEVKSGIAMKEQIERERSMLKNQPTSFIDKDMYSFSSISAQIKKTHKKDKCDQETKGNVEFISSFGNGQEPGSAQENIYQEVRGAIETTVSNIPVTIEGYYTTQDASRKAKASYFKFHYDVEGSKNQLLDKIAAFKGKYNEAKTMRLENTYQFAINTLVNENNIIASKFKIDYRLDIHSIGSGDNLSNLLDLDTADLKNAAKNKAGANDKAQKAGGKKAEIQEKYNRYNANKAKIKKYETLLRQYKNQMYFDSALTYKNLERLNGDVSYKKLVKASSNLLPHNKGNKILTGITNFDAGIFNRYESDYTLSGQNVKGANIGYDFGFVTTSFTAGKTEYISRDGNVDVYNSYMLRADSRISKNHHVGLIYYGYSPTRKIVLSDRFKSDVTAPTFFVPVQIVSLVYAGDIAKNVTVNAEAASSFKRTLTKAKPDMDNSAIKTGVTYDIPVLKSSIEGEWEHMGRYFENSALPVIRNGTERYTIADKTSLFRSFVSVGVQYNFLKQSTFSTTGYSTKWGFDLKTHFKQYPNLYVSYKPFSTFRAYNDTLAIPQRPLFGEVLIVRGTYQFKVQNVTHRFMAIYNQNRTSLDTSDYKSKSVQLGYIYTSASNMLSVNTGWLSQSPGMDSTIIGNSWFVNVLASHNLTKQLNINLGQDIAWTKRAIEKLSTTAGMSYAFTKLPLIWNMQVRYTHFTSNLYSDKKNLIAGLLGLNWQFRLKKKCSTMY